MGNLTINTTAPEDVRLAAAFGAYLGLGTGVNATGPQVKAAVVNFVKQTVLSYEQQQAVNAAIASTVPIAPT